MDQLPSWLTDCGAAARSGCKVVRLHPVGDSVRGRLKHFMPDRKKESDVAVNTNDLMRGSSLARPLRFSTIGNITARIAATQSRPAISGSAEHPEHCPVDLAVIIEARRDIYCDIHMKTCALVVAGIPCAQR